MYTPCLTIECPRNALSILLKTSSPNGAKVEHHFGKQISDIIIDSSLIRQVQSLGFPAWLPCHFGCSVLLLIEYLESVSRKSVANYRGSLQCYSYQACQYEDKGTNPPLGTYVAQWKV